MIAFDAWILSCVYVLPDSDLLLAYAVIEITSFNSLCNKKPEIFVIWVVRHALYWSFGFRFARSALTRGDPECRFVCHGLELSYYVHSTCLLRTFNVLTSFVQRAYLVRSKRLLRSMWHDLVLDLYSHHSHKCIIFPFDNGRSQPLFVLHAVRAESWVT